MLAQSAGEAAFGYDCTRNTHPGETHATARNGRAGKLTGRLAKPAVHPNRCCAVEQLSLLAAQIALCRGVITLYSKYGVCTYSVHNVVLCARSFSLLTASEPRTVSGCLPEVASPRQAITPKISHYQSTALPRHDAPTVRRRLKM